MSIWLQDNNQFDQVVIMFALFYYFGLEAIVDNIDTEGLKVDIQPVERIALNVFVLHTEVDFSIMISGKVDRETLVFILE